MMIVFGLTTTIKTNLCSRMRQFIGFNCLLNFLLGLYLLLIIIRPFSLYSGANRSPLFSGSISFITLSLRSFPLFCATMFLPIFALIFPQAVFILALPFAHIFLFALTDFWPLRIFTRLFSPTIFAIGPLAISVFVVFIQGLFLSTFTTNLCFHIENYIINGNCCQCQL